MIYWSLKTALVRQTTQRHDDEVTLHRLDRTAARQLMRLRIEGQGPVQMDVTVTATHVGGNVYDIVCETEEGASRRISYALPAGSGTASSGAPGLGQKLGQFLVTEFEQHLGRCVLSNDEPSPAV
jgi:hypothetical protein